ncbi:MAG TPA: exonuclease domain-containing protein [Stellaceae bacterium]|nr:exonuclease domain-containing protein [Stellaceae bacterium]
MELAGMIEKPITPHRVIVLDTETTGVDPAAGHRLVGVACVELCDLAPSDRELHFYCNPECEVPEAAYAVHGLSTAFLVKHRRFAEQAPEFLDFIAGADILVAHNASFDIGFLDAELHRAGLPRLKQEIVDTVALARQKFPGAPAALDALCLRFGIELGDRAECGSSIDPLLFGTRLLAQVFVKLMGVEPADLTSVKHAERDTPDVAVGGDLPLPRPEHSHRPPVAVPSSGLTIRQAAEILDEDEAWLSEIALDLGTEEGCFRLREADGTETTVFTYDGVETLRQHVVMHRRLGTRYK